MGAKRVFCITCRMGQTVEVPNSTIDVYIACPDCGRKIRVKGDKDESSSKEESVSRIQRS